MRYYQLIKWLKCKDFIKEVQKQIEFDASINNLLITGPDDVLWNLKFFIEDYKRLRCVFHEGNKSLLLDTSQLYVYIKD